MRRLNRPRHVPQLDLFRPVLPKLEWRQLPTEVRGKATHLMARLLRQRQPPRADDEPAGGRDDE
jgi:hypothetical protein